jgi:Tfp pilus assembly protein PilF
VSHTDESLFTRNLDLLHRHHPAIHELLNQGSESIGEIFISLSGKPNFRARTTQGQDVIFHDQPDPETEIRTYLEKVTPAFTGVVIMIGMGLGYSPQALVANRNGIRNFILCEPHIGIFIQALRALDLAPLLSDPRVTLNIGPTAVENIEQAIQPAARTLQLETAHILRHLPSFQFDEIYTALNKKIFDYANNLNVGGSTSMKQGKNFFANRFQNITALTHHRLIDNLAETFHGVPAILVAAGPSLDKNIRLLRDIQQNALIMAVDTALPALLAHGIQPHFVAAIDGDEVIYEKIAACASHAHGTSLLCQGHVTPKIVKTFPADTIFWAFSGNELEQWIYESLFDRKQTLEMGAWSVAHFNLAAAILMGASPIIFIGQDLAYSHNRDHAAHTVLTESNHMAKILKERNDDLVWVDGWDGGKVPTHRGFYGVKCLFEEMLSQHPDRHFINATEGGARLEGAEHIPLSKALANHCANQLGISDTLRLALEKSCPPPMEKFHRHASAIFKDVTDLHNALKENKTRTEQAIKQVSKLARSSKKYQQFATLPPQLRKTLQALDDSNKKTDSAGIIWPLLCEITLPGLKENERLRHALSALDNNPGRYLEWLQGHLHRLQVVNNTQMDALDFFSDQLSAFLVFQESEQQLNKLAKTTDAADDTLLRLARLYMDKGYLTLAAPVLEKLKNTTSGARPEVLFFLGCIASEQRNEDQCQALFQEALDLAPETEARIKNFRIWQGDNFLRYAEEYRKFDKGTFRALLFKGLIFCPDHPQILQELQTSFWEEIQKPGPNAEEARTATLYWHEQFQLYPSLLATLPAAQQASFGHGYGCILAEQGQYQEALPWLEQAVRLQADNPEYQASLTSVLFDLGDFANGVLHLKAAVALEPSYASHWEEIGDSLLAAGQHVDALAAYEQCFLALPDRSGVLKKIGDCYLHMGQLDAAKTAYEQFKAAHTPNAS